MVLLDLKFKPEKRLWQSLSVHSSNERSEALAQIRAAISKFSFSPIEVFEP